MDCSRAQELISPFLDRELDQKSAAAVQAHLGTCQQCAKLFNDFDAIIDLCGESFNKESAPPNPQALWRRINNIIETDAAQVSDPEAEEPGRSGWFSGIWNQNVRFSASQIASAVVGVALVSSLLTVITIANFFGPVGEFPDSESESTLFEKALAGIGVGETPLQKAQRRVHDRQTAIRYWSKRVELRRAQWNADTKLIFDRNLNEIDKAVNEFTRILNKDPQDSINNEMLDSALREKMALLREFSEL